MKTILLVIALVAKADAPKADLPAGGVLPSAASAAGCALVDLFKGDAGFLTGPWGAAWRL